MARLEELDLDLAEEDFRQDPIVMPIKGLGEFTFPGTINALAKTRILAWQAEGRGAADLTFTEAITLFRDLITDDVIRDLSNAGFDILAEENLPRVEQIVNRLMAEYGRREHEREQTRPGGVEAAATPPPFSGTGPSSSPTSDVSTTSPFPAT